jgi:hypothetical protein
VIDPEATTRKVLSDRECRCCGRPASNGHHIVPKGAPWFGDDIEDNIVPVCGTGTTGCHGALHGNGYTDLTGKRWTPEIVTHRIGERLRPEELAAVAQRFGGVVPAAEYLSRRYGLTRLWANAALTAALEGRTLPPPVDAAPLGLPPAAPLTAPAAAACPPPPPEARSGADKDAWLHLPQPRVPAGGPGCPPAPPAPVPPAAAAAPTLEDPHAPLT